MDISVELSTALMTGLSTVPKRRLSTGLYRGVRFSVFRSWLLIALISCQKLIYWCISQLSTGLLRCLQVRSATAKNRDVAHKAVDDPLGLSTADLIRLLFDWNLKCVLWVNFLDLDFPTAIFSKLINGGTVHDLNDIFF